MADISKIDKNLQVAEVSDDGNTVYYDVKCAPFSVYGLYDYKNQSPFKRLPDEVGLNVNSGVAQLYLNTAGGRARFSTDSSRVCIKAVLNGICRFPHMPLTGTAGFDLYIDSPDGSSSKYYGSFVPPYDISDALCAEISFGSKKLRHITVNLPSYSGVSALYVGLDSGALVAEGAKYKSVLPIVFYGSSITQGACSSRPGNIYQSIISRHTQLDYINLGFSGSGKGEDLIVDYISKLDMCAFISDYDHNAPSPEHLRNTHLKMYKKIRAAHPSIPYIMLSKCDFNKNYDDSVKRRQVIEDTYRYARLGGDRNVYFIDGESVFCGPYEDMCTVEGTHPTDVGMALLAEKIEAVLRKAFMRQQL